MIFKEISVYYFLFWLVRHCTVQIKSSLFIFRNRETFVKFLLHVTMFGQVFINFLFNPLKMEPFIKSKAIETYFIHRTEAALTVVSSNAFIKNF